MNRMLLKKNLIEARLLWFSCAIMLFAFSWARVWMITRLEMGRFKAVFEQLRQFERFSPVPFEHLFTYTGRIAMLYDEPIVILCMVVWAIARGSDAVSGELGRGTMEVLLSQPVSRLQVLGSQAIVTVGGMVALAFLVWLGVYVGIQTTVIQEEVPAKLLTIPGLSLDIPNPLGKPEKVPVAMATKTDGKYFIPATVNLFCLAFFLAGLSTLMSSWDRYRWRTIGIVVGIYVIQLTIKIAGLAATDLSWLMNLSFFTAYEPEAFTSVALHQPDQTWTIWRADHTGTTQRLGALGANLLLVGMGTAFYVAANVIFSKRDLPAPL